MKSHLNLMTAAAIVVCLAFSTKHSQAQTHTWTNTLGGIFSDNANWDIGAPGPNATAFYNSTSTYGVAITADDLISILSVVGGDVGFVGGNQLRVSELGSFRGGITRFLNNGTELYANRISVGGQVNGILQVESRGKVTSENELDIASPAGWNGTVTVTGTASLLEVGSILSVAGAGNGFLNIEDEGQVSATQTVIGRNSDGIGAATITDEDAALNTDELLIGVHPSGGTPGVGTLNLESGGDVFVGNNQPTTNTGSNLYVSNNGTPSMMYVGNGSAINNDGGAYIGFGNGSFGEVTIDDATWFNDDTLRVGHVGNGTLNIENAGSVILPTNKAVLVATNVGSTGDLNVDGTGTTLVAGDVWAGTRGAGTMNVTNGGDVDNAGGNGFIAGLGGNTTATVNGVGSRWFNSNLYLGGTAGATGGVGTLNVENQATVYVGNNVPSISDALVISDGGTNGFLVAKNGSTINCQDSFIGYGVNNSGFADISGVGTTWNVAGELTVGRLGSGSLNITAGASVVAGETFVNDMSEIVLDSSQLDVGSSLSNEGLLHFSSGSSQVAGRVGNLPGGDITVDSTARVAFLNDFYHTGNPILVDGEIFFLDGYLGQNAITGIGDVNFAGALRPFSSAAGQIFFAGGINVIMESGAQTEIDIAGTGNFDRMTVSGDLRLNGSITINWLGGFTPSLGQEYVIANVVGDSTGQFSGMTEGDMLTQVGNIGVFISYEAGDGNDVALFTDLVPDIVTPDEFTVIRGTYVSGGLLELANSDNQDLSIRRSTADIQSRTVLEVASFATSANPSHIEVTVEGSVFARSTVVQSIEVYNYDSGQFETVDARNASRFSDSSTTVVLSGNLSRYVEEITNAVTARVRYQSLSPRQQFSSNTDLFTWGFAD